MPSTPRSISGSPSAGDSYLPTSGNSGYSVEHYDIELDYRVSTNRLVATTVITAVATVALDRFSLDLSGLIVDKVTVAGARPKKVTSTARKLVITPEAPFASGERFEVAVRYHGSPHPMRSGWGDVGWEELADGVLVASQPNGASSWFPCNDHPSNKATYDITVLSEPAYTVVANGTLLSKTPTAGRLRWTFAVAEPMATYLATVQIGRYRSKTVADEGPTTTLYYPAQLAASVDVDFERVGDMIAVFADRFGPYPFETYGVIVTPDVLEIPLEAHGLAIFGSNHVDGRHGTDRLIAHELAHQWFGNSLTVTSWKDIWLQEGFACYAEWIWGEASGGQSADLAAEHYWKIVDNQPKDIVVGDPGPRLMFDDRVYKRGALGLHAVRRAIGDDAFFAALRSLTATCRFGGVTLADLITAFGENGAAVSRILDRWVYSKSLPKLR